MPLTLPVGPPRRPRSGRSETVPPQWTVEEDAANLIIDTFFDGLVDVTLLDEVVATVTAGYARGLAGTVDTHTVGRAIRLTGAAKYFWLGPRMLNQLGAPTSGAAYDTRDVADMFAGRRRPLELVTAWFRDTFRAPR